MNNVEPLIAKVRQQLAATGAELSPNQVAQALRNTGHPVGDVTVLAVHDALELAAVGAGPLQVLLNTPGVTDVLVNGPEQVFFDAGAGMQLSQIRFSSDNEVRALAQRLAAGAGRRLDDASPYVDVRLADGTRFHAVLAPVSRPGTLLSFRVPRAAVFSLSELIAAGFCTTATASILESLIRNKVSFVISGGTGTGKTTLLNALLSLVSPAERLVLVEDASELRPEHPHLVGLEARPANIEGKGEIELQTLVRQALRMRPDRVVVGEVRGAEIVDLFAALNTGHRGGCATVHANNAAGVVSRLIGLGLTAGLPLAAIKQQLSEAISVVLHIDRDAVGCRRLVEIGVLANQPELEVLPAWCGFADEPKQIGWAKLEALCAG